jgi:hypothetical protein
MKHLFSGIVTDSLIDSTAGNRNIQKLGPGVSVDQMHIHGQC